MRLLQWRVVISQTAWTSYFYNGDGVGFLWSRDWSLKHEAYVDDLQASEALFHFNEVWSQTDLATFVCHVECCCSSVCHPCNIARSIRTQHFLSTFSIKRVPLLGWHYITWAVVITSLNKAPFLVTALNICSENRRAGAATSPSELCSV